MLNNNNISSFRLMGLCAVPCCRVCHACCAQVWNSVDQHSRRSYTSVIHGKYSHEETIATASFADTYVIVRDLAEAQMVSSSGSERQSSSSSSSAEDCRQWLRVSSAATAAAAAVWALAARVGGVCLRAVGVRCDAKALCIVT